MVSGLHSVQGQIHGGQNVYIRPCYGSQGWIYVFENEEEVVRVFSGVDTGFRKEGGRGGGGVPGNCFERICATFFSHFMKFWGPQKAGGGGVPDPPPWIRPCFSPFMKLGGHRING